MSPGSPSFLVLAKPKPGLEESVAFLRRHGAKVETILGKVGDPFPEAAARWEGDFLVSYICPWIVPKEMLSRPRRAAVNFHPGPPEYPGIGCTNFALYDGASVFGVTAHHMAPKVDTGTVIAVERFPIKPEDGVASLTERCYENIRVLFEKVFTAFFSTGALPISGETWTRKPYKRSELDALCRLEPTMTQEEIRRRVRATHYPGMPGPFIEMFGLRFDYRS